ncbi:MAG: metal-dependent hydrolase [Candidatus Heimdallarchaeota archaeon]|nr:MAG: metal-dependent hydrolase [Candidatus Gerdarchaeota archaeon]RLI70371.1 MAG: metal-dependent hydrolase [Candidatus Gerdarchaeota archaeon]
MKVTWLGHAGIEIEDQGKTIFIDPWLTGNPVATKKVDEIKKADAVFVTHDHGDHGYADAVTICKNTGATFVGIFELANKAKEDGVGNVLGGNIGGTATVAGIEFVFTEALHSSSVGAPLGFVIKLPSMTVYHAGDTGLFMGMKLLGELYDVDLAFLPIGSLFTMGPKEAAKALELLSCQKVIPIHYKTFPVLTKSAEEFSEIVGPMIDVIALEPGDSKEF